MTEANELYYSKKKLTAEQLREEIADFWAELETNPELQAQLSQVGISKDALDVVRKSDAITVGVDSSGADPTVLLIIAFAPTANRILKDVWATVILPRIRTRRGNDAIGSEVNNPER